MKDLHTFSICAYKESEYLEDCIRSIKKQTVKSNVIICTSTPCEYIQNLADKYSIPVYVRVGKSDIRDDWNFAYNKAETPYVTVAHQDDVYNKDYVKALQKVISKRDGDFLMFYTGYRPLKENKITRDINCAIRAFLRVPMLCPLFANNRFFKKSTLAFGNSICCPTVTYNKKKLGADVFTSEMKFNIDWDTFLKLAKFKGRFAYDHRSLVYYRVHDGATSKEFIENHGRIAEDEAMFRKFWPRPIVKLLMVFYKRAYKTYG